MHEMETLSEMIIQASWDIFFFSSKIAILFWIFSVVSFPPLIAIFAPMTLLWQEHDQYSPQWWIHIKARH